MALKGNKTLKGITLTDAYYKIRKVITSKEDGIGSLVFIYKDKAQRDSDVDLNKIDQFNYSIPYTDGNPLPLLYAAIKAEMGLTDA